jgi:hypothetical protein
VQCGWPTLQRRTICAVKPSRIFCYTLVSALLLAAAPRLPAPIVEESATPVPEHSAKPKRTRKSKATSETSESSTERKAVESESKRKLEASESVANPPRHMAGPYAGSWQGIINCGIWGNVEHVIVIDDSQATIRVSRGAVGLLGPYDRTVNALIGSDGITAQLPGLDGKWTLKPYPDGRTALVTLAAPFLNSSAVFRRMSDGPASISTSQPAQPAAVNQRELPTAKPVPGRPGFVYNPFDSNSKVLLDVRGHPAGSKVKDPGSGKLFIVP